MQRNTIAAIPTAHRLSEPTPHVPSTVERSLAESLDERLR
eukprot:CAMPEP_0177575084 /NCGR_PEP_ID=MMETSP0369-20130122/79412_1 /TAXON_ID=447022 ORGANISM="Scrippsiella hangoei-like, Strain SHHI-4" /NCGR_SAMPLE_ID=MMETSP0369 /ASSEMBLY_ACC=CAM_ASM_000364 /LENGTH=39 /DNA_ID= /DNA_START= /DNA_END= /DNA_ORIENTATION=